MSTNLEKKDTLWTTTPPTAPGYYWATGKDFGRVPQVIWIVMEGGELVVRRMGCSPITLKRACEKDPRFPVASFSAAPILMPGEHAKKVEAAYREGWHMAAMLLSNCDRNSPLAHARDEHWEASDAKAALEGKE